MRSKNKSFRRTLLPVLLCYVALPTYSAPVVSQVQAMTKAQQFSQSVTGSLMDAANGFNTAQPRFPAASEHRSADKAPDDPANNDLKTILGNHPHGYWRIERPGQYHLEVDDLTGHILSYVDYTASDVANDPPAGEAIPRPQARQIAGAALQATGVPLGNYAFAYAEEMQGHSPPTASEHEWYISWTRTFQGIPYRREGAGVFLAAETGKVISVRVDEQSVDPATAGEKVPQEQALNMAEAQLQAAGITTSELPQVTASKEIVPFNHYWATGDEAHHSLQSYVAWNCRYTLPGETLEVWIDANTGDVVGGYYAGTLGRSGKFPLLKLGHQLKRSEIKDEVKPQPYK